MHRTSAGEERKALMKEARELEREAQSLEKISHMSPAARTRQDEADRLRAKAEDLKSDARLEDLRVWEMEKVKTTKSGSQSYGYWMATWRENGKVRNVHLGSSRKISHEQALQIARAMKAEALGISVR
ncbi:MAG: hypothetical protein HPY61_09315 [Methanotrichaceae archaeon]|nr:hypothetical protein [Methanotrichaceae archaeon]